MTANERPAPPRTGTGPSENHCVATSELVPASQCTGGADSSTSATLGRLLRDRGIALANGNGDAWWRDCFDTALDHVAATRDEFTTDDVLAQGVPVPDHPNRVGAATNAAMQAGRIRAVGYRSSTRPSRHAGVLRVWTAGGAA